MKTATQGPEIGDEVWVAGRAYTVVRLTKRAVHVERDHTELIFTWRRDGSWRVKGGSVRLWF